MNLQSVLIMIGMQFMQFGLELYVLNLNSKTYVSFSDKLEVCFDDK